MGKDSDKITYDPKIKGLKPVTGFRRKTGGWSRLNFEDRMYLAELFIVTNLSLEAISKLYDVTEMSLRGWLKQYCEINNE